MKFIAGIIGKSITAKWVTNKKVIIVVSIFIALLPFFFMLFSTSSKNYKTTYLKQKKAGYKVTVKGKRVLMSHDPISAFLPNTYEDSTSFLIPRQHGIINCNKICSIGRKIY